MRVLRALWGHPRILLLIFSLIVIWRVIALGHLTYGDIPYFDVTSSQVNFMYAWGSEQLGAPVRQSLNTFRDAVLLLVSPLSIVFYLLKYVAPLILIPQLYYWIFSRLGLRSKPVLLLGALFPLFTPIVFGDFLTGQTFWIYLTIPMVLFYAIKIFALQQFTLRNDVLLALWLFLSLGMLPPIIVPLMAVVAIFALAMLLVHASLETWRVLVRYLISAVRIGIIFGLLAAPYLLIASSGQAAYTAPSLLSDYYHNYSETHLFNTLRMAGNNGSGQSTLGYNEWSLTNLVGYGIAAVMFGGGIILGLRQKVSRYWAVITGLLAVLLVVLGFMQLLTINTLFGTRVFESQWIVSTVRNPSKLYAILLPIFALLFTFGLGNILQKYGKSSHRQRVILLAVGAMVAIYGWPALRGDLGLLSGREEAAPSYKQDAVVQQIAKSPSAQDGRALLLPATHRDELNYQFLNPNFNVLRLEGSLPGSTQTMDALNDALNERNPYFFRYLDALGIKTIFVKKDKNAYKRALFDLFSVRLNAGQTYDFLAHDLKLAHQTGDYWEFHNSGASDLVYSPETMTYIKDTRSHENAAPYYAKNRAVVMDANSQQSQYTTVFQAQDALGENQTIRAGKAQLHDPSLLIADLYRDTSSGQPQAVFDIISPVDGRLERSVRIPLGTDGAVVSLDESDYIVTNQKQRVTVRAADYLALVSTLQPVQLPGVDASFENADAWKAGDANPRASGTASIYTAANPDATSGKNSLELGSESHKAFISLPMPQLDDQHEYILQFEYKNLRGSSPSFGLYQGKQSLLPADGGLASQNDWRTQTVFFSPQENSKDQIQFFYYTEGSQRDPSENLIDSVRLFQVTNGQITPVNIPSYPPDYSLTNYQVPELLDQFQGQNLLTNGSFENESLWGTVGDATSGAKGKPDISMSRSPDHTDGRGSLELRSRNHTAYVSRKMTRFIPNAVYKLSFDYKHVMGRLPSFAVWQDGAAMSRPSGELEAGDGWSHYETYFVPDPQTTNMTVYFYSRSSGERTVNLYDNVKLETASLVSTYLSEQSDPQQPLKPIVESYKRINPTQVQVTMRPGTGMLVFNESFHQGWQAYIDPQTPIKTHQVVNGFANGWWIDAGSYPQANQSKNYTITLRYEPQNLLSGGLAVMGITLSAIIVYLIIGVWRERRRPT